MLNIIDGDKYDPHDMSDLGIVDSPHVDYDEDDSDDELIF
jgi:hypothetical protein